MSSSQLKGTNVKLVAGSSGTATAGGCKPLYQKLILTLLALVSFVAILSSPVIHHPGHWSGTPDHEVAIHHRNRAEATVSGYQARTLDHGGPVIRRWSHAEEAVESSNRSRMPDHDESESGYVSDLNINWSEVSRAIGDGGAGGGGRAEELRVGLLNFDANEVEAWKEAVGNATVEAVRLEHAPANVTWDSLFPEWIDEEEVEEVPSCPTLPAPAIPVGVTYDLIAVKLPCKNTTNWTQDVARLHLQLAAATLTVSEGTNEERRTAARVVVVSKCFPMPNLFKCKHLVWREGSIWVFKPDVDELAQKLRLPVGSCKLALPFKAVDEHAERPHTSAAARQREAYATILHSEHLYVCGAIALAQSLRQAGTTRDMVILVDETIGDHHRRGLTAAGWRIRTIQRIRNPKATPDAYNEWNYSKFWLWRLTEYDKVIFLDADVLVLRLPDALFSLPEVSAKGNNASLFNSGVMVVEPSVCTFDLLMDHVSDIKSYNGGDQGYLNEVFSWWHRVPSYMNYMKHFWAGDSVSAREEKERLFTAEPAKVLALHFVGMKPWLCFRDYDCNWNVAELLEFASDAAHARWWKVHDRMPDELKEFCLLEKKQKEQLRWDVRQAAKANFSDGHWRIAITDQRPAVCASKVCEKRK